MPVLNHSDRLDTLRPVETPEGIELTLHVAGPVVRASAWLLDQLIRLGIYMLLFPLLGQAGVAGQGLILLSLFLIEWFYPVVFEVLRNGATPGKSTLGIQVLQDDGTPVTLASSMLRNLLRAVDFLPLLYGLGLVSIILSRDFQRLGDIAAGTLVVYREQRQRKQQVPEQRPLAPAVRLTLEEQAAIIEFAERQARLTPARREELAGLAGAVLPDPQREPDEQLTGVANWLLGSAGTTKGRR